MNKEAERPWGTELLILIASSRVSNFMTNNIGTKYSCYKHGAHASGISIIVGWTKFPGPSKTLPPIRILPPYSYATFNACS